MKVAGAKALALSTVLAWSAADVMVAAWAVSRDARSTDFHAHRVAFYAANLNALAFGEPQKLADEGRTLESKAPAWEQQPTKESTGSFDDFAAMAARMGAV